MMVVYMRKPISVLLVLTVSSDGARRIASSAAFPPSVTSMSSWSKPSVFSASSSWSSWSTSVALVQQQPPSSTGDDPPGCGNALSGEDVAVSDNARPERGKPLPDPASPKDLYEAYSEIQQDYERKAFHNRKWQVLNDKHNVKVSLLKHPQDPSCPYVKMEGRIPVPVEECWEWLRVDDWDRTMKVMDPFYEGSEIYGEYSYELPATDLTKAHWRRRSENDKENSSKKNIIRMLLCRKRTKRILAFGKRDLVFLSVTEDLPAADGSWVSGTVSVRTAQLPRQKGYTRAFQDSIAFYKPVKNNTETDLTIVCRIDLNDSGDGGEGGYIPMWIYVQTIGYTAAESVYKMRRALIREHEEKQQQENAEHAKATLASTEEVSPMAMEEKREAVLITSQQKSTRIWFGIPRLLSKKNDTQSTS